MHIILEKYGVPSEDCDGVKYSSMFVKSTKDIVFVYDNMSPYEIFYILCDVCERTISNKELLLNSITNCSFTNINIQNGLSVNPWCNEVYEKMFKECIINSFLDMDNKNSYYVEFRRALLEE